MDEIRLRKTLQRAFSAVAFADYRISNKKIATADQFSLDEPPAGQHRKDDEKNSMIGAARAVISAAAFAFRLTVRYADNPGRAFVRN